MCVCIYEQQQQRGLLRVWSSCLAAVKSDLSAAAPAQIALIRAIEIGRN